MTDVHFVVTADFDSASRAVWDELVDWKAHEAWIPATRVEVDGAAPMPLARLSPRGPGSAGWRSRIACR